MDLKTAFDKLYLHNIRESASQALAYAAIYGTYDIGGYLYIFLHVNQKAAIKEQHRVEKENDIFWNTVQGNLLDVARTLNFDMPSANAPYIIDTLPFVFYDDCPDDPEFATIEFSIVEAWGQSAHLHTLRRAIKTCFDNYRIHTFCEPLSGDSFYNALSCYTEKDHLTRRKLTVKVRKQELTCHVLAGQFKIRDPDDTDK
jgi:hypothetical protein